MNKDTPIQQPQPQPQANPVYIQKESGSNKVLIYVAVGVGTLYGLHKLQRYFEDEKRRKAEQRAASDINVGQALGLRSAMNPSGNLWMFYFDGTNTDAIFKIAAEIKELPKVQTEYENMYGKDSLLQDLKSEISAQGLDKFLAIASKGVVGSKYYAPEKIKQPVGSFAIAKAKVNIRSTPVKVAALKLIPGGIVPLIPVPTFKNNVLKVAEIGKLLGVTTGKAVYDEAADVLFIEIVMLTQKLEKKFAWVAKSQVDLLTKEEKQKQEKIKPFKVETLEGIQLSGLVSGFDLAVIVKSPATLYNEAKKKVSVVFPGITLGFFEKRVTSGKTNWIKFKTVQGFTRWVNENEIKLIQQDK